MISLISLRARVAAQDPEMGQGRGAVPSPLVGEG